MKKRNVKKLEVAKETLRTLDLKNVAGQAVQNLRYFDPDYTMNIECSFSTIA